MFLLGKLVFNLICVLCILDGLVWGLKRNLIEKCWKEMLVLVVLKFLELKCKFFL